ncbi:hypothetical protein OG389_28825 [Streptomyces sp. NBC_00435]|uniref:hypothetical protein n=1 Tax=Streptomyces sp. NBC_00435 TaxID=2903649 RepID=UPI002E1B3B77
MPVSSAFASGLPQTYRCSDWRGDNSRGSDWWRNCCASWRGNDRPSWCWDNSNWDNNNWNHDSWNSNWNNRDHWNNDSWNDSRHDGNWNGHDGWNNDSGNWHDSGHHDGNNRNR